jgi:hypothetical protein
MLLEMVEKAASKGVTLVVERYGTKIMKDDDVSGDGGDGGDKSN